MSIIIRQEEPADIKRIDALVAAAFQRPDEVVLVNRLRAAGAVWLSQAALLDGNIVGYALYSMATVTDGIAVHEYPALGPIAVAKACQRQGIGGELIRAGLRAAKDAGHGLMFVVGHPSYYPRFGFRPAQPLGFTSDYVKASSRHEHFMAAALDSGRLGAVRGHLRFHPAFAGQQPDTAKIRTHCLKRLDSDQISDNIALDSFR